MEVKREKEKKIKEREDRG